ncbi:MAG TPA: hypothetical protein VK279_05620 [Solirubrobacteraceae bacterium]|nr:hypothetical protein [Solirubrobacteraceae bacterium]
MTTAPSPPPAAAMPPPPAARGRGRGTEAAVFAAVALAVAGLFLLAPTYPGLDTYYHLVWGRELLDGATPSFDGYRAPTHHPLWVAVGALAAVFGRAGERVVVLVALGCLVAFLWAVYRLGAAVLGRWTGVVGAVLAAGSFAFLLYAVRAFVDVPFLALVLWAAVLAVERPGRPARAMALLALAGLLRPDAWLLAALWWLWARRGRPARKQAGLAALAVVAPVIWLAVDWIATGRPLFSFTATSSLAEELRHEGGALDVPGAYVGYLAGTLRAPVLALAAVGLVLALRAVGRRRLVVPLTLIAAGSATFALTGLAGLSILPRYLTVPAAGLCLFAAYALVGWTTVPDARWWRRLGIAGLVAGALGGAAFAALSAGRVTGELRFVRASHADLARLLADPRVRAALRCGPLVLPTDRLVPDARWLLDAPPGAVLARTAPARRGIGVQVTVAGEKAVNRFAQAASIPRATNRVAPGAVGTVRAGRFTGHLHRCPRG